jgi:hypothetical protein
MVRINIILGVPPKGYDAKNPDAGSFMASTFNDMLMGPLIESFRNTPDLDESMNAVIRHMIEEYSNLRHFVPELYAKHSKLAAAGVTWIPTLGTFLDRLDLTPSDRPTVNFYEQLRLFVEKMPQMDVSDTAVGQTIIRKAEAVSNTLNYSPISAKYAQATPEKIKRPPEFDSVVRARDEAMETVNSMVGILGSTALATATASLGASSASEAQNALARLSALRTRATGLVDQIQTGVGGLDGMVKQAVAGKVTATAVEFANNAAHEVQVKAYQLSLMRDALMAILKAAKSNGVIASLPATVTVVKEQPQSSIALDQPQSSVRDQPQSSVRDQPQSSVIREQPQSASRPVASVSGSKAVTATASATVPLGPIKSLGIQFDASFTKPFNGVDVSSDEQMSEDELKVLGDIFNGGMFAGLADIPQPIAKGPLNLFSTTQGGSGSGTVVLPTGPAANSGDDEYHDEAYYYDDEEGELPPLSILGTSPVLPMVGYNMESAALKATTTSSSSSSSSSKGSGSLASSSSSKQSPSSSSSSSSSKSGSSSSSSKTVSTSSKSASSQAPSGSASPKSSIAAAAASNVQLQMQMGKDQGGKSTLASTQKG